MDALEFVGRLRGAVLLSLSMPSLRDLSVVLDVVSNTGSDLPAALQTLSDCSAVTAAVFALDTFVFVAKFKQVLTRCLRECISRQAALSLDVVLLPSSEFDVRVLGFTCCTLVPADPRLAEGAEDAPMWVRDPSEPSLLSWCDVRRMCLHCPVLPPCTPMQKQLLQACNELTQPRKKRRRQQLDVSTAVSQVDVETSADMQIGRLQEKLKAASARRVTLENEVRNLKQKLERVQLVGPSPSTAPSPVKKTTKPRAEAVVAVPAVLASSQREVSRLAQIQKACAAVLARAFVRAGPRTTAKDKEPLFAGGPSRSQMHLCVEGKGMPEVLAESAETLRRLGQMIELYNTVLSEDSPQHYPRVSLSKGTLDLHGETSFYFQHMVALALSKSPTDPVRPHLLASGVKSMGPACDAIRAIVSEHVLQGLRDHGMRSLHVAEQTRVVVLRDITEVAMRDAVMLFAKRKDLGEDVAELFLREDGRLLQTRAGRYAALIDSATEYAMTCLEYKVYDFIRCVLLVVAGDGATAGSCYAMHVAALEVPKVAEVVRRFAESMQWVQEFSDGVTAAKLDPSSFPRVPVVFTSVCEPRRQC